MLDGLGHRDWVNEVADATTIDQYLQSQTVMRFATTAARGTAITAPKEGAVTYIDADNVISVYTGTAWLDVVGGSRVYLDGIGGNDYIEYHDLPTDEIRVVIGGSGRFAVNANGRVSSNNSNRLFVQNLAIGADDIKGAGGVYMEDTGPTVTLRESGAAAGLAYQIVAGESGDFYIRATLDDYSTYVKRLEIEDGDGTLALYDGDGNTALIVGGTGDRRASFYGGTDAAPGLSIIGDLDTGLFSPASDQFGVTAGGVQQALFTDVGSVANATLYGNVFLTGVGSAASINDLQIDGPAGSNNGKVFYVSSSRRYKHNERPHDPLAHIDVLPRLGKLYEWRGDTTEYSAIAEDVAAVSPWLAKYAWWTDATGEELSDTPGEGVRGPQDLNVRAMLIALWDRVAEIEQTLANQGAAA